MKEVPPGIADYGDLPVFRIETTPASAGFFCALVAELVSRNMRVLIVSLPPGNLLSADPVPSPESLRLAGADLLDLSDRQGDCRPDPQKNAEALSLLADLTLVYDIVLVEGDCRLPLTALQLRTIPAAASIDPAEMTLVIDPRRGVTACADHIFSQITGIWLKTPVWACVLIGGRSSRMGRPKHLLERKNGRTWLEETVEVLRPHVGKIVLSGQGAIPSSIREYTRIADVPAVAGPLAGILAAMRWQPEVSWILVACDMPGLTSAAVEWLLAARRPGRWAIIPRRAEDSHVEPLLACYDRRSRSLLETLRRSGSLRIGRAASHPKVYSPVIPRDLLPAWDNINTPAEFEAFGVVPGEEEWNGRSSSS